ncbi:rhamnosyltransferase [Hathewaya proteolytica DSM 3090]|uniref:Rhamnosyltransferase n=1 Tax=Hathewaya proteolytica DSM 3090 TaxID=1121331 RepID=A0A1M6PSR0_9CLOT|nr:glycosyltransferase [Hathewaya proteolytica]SHK10940.1 rhamnosyltransferase [Hathewaya proteolytica DSM 3090]
MDISIICPLYKGEGYIEKLHKSILKQEKVDIRSIKYVLTETGDNSEDILKRLHCEYSITTPEEFSHSTTREIAAMEAKGSIVVFITQDIIVKDSLWLYNLTQPISEGQCEAAFSRQICEERGIEKYIREKNYEKNSRIVSKDSIPQLGFRTFFFSDAASAIRRDIFVELKGYDGKRMPTNEDMYFAYKLITNGYRIKYCANSWVVHSHKFTLKQLYKRYYDTGVFLGQNRYLLEYKANKTGFSLFSYVLKRAWQEREYQVIFQIVPNFAARYLGTFFGKRHNK